MVEGIPDAARFAPRAFSTGFAPKGHNPFAPTGEIKW
jgi:hypothetical protein